MKAKVIAGQHHLAQAKPWTKGREEANGSDGQEVDEEDGQQRIDEAELEDRYGQRTNGKRRDDHVGSQPLFRISSAPPVLVSFARSTQRTIVPTLCRFSSVLSSSGTLSIPRASILYRAAKR